MAYDPCNPVPDNTIPAGFTPTHHHAAHHVVGRIKHRIHHKFVHLGPPAQAPVPEGCEKHAITGPGYGHGAPAAPLSKAAAVGGAGAGLVALGGLGGIGGLVGGIIPGITRTSAKTTITGPGPTTGIPGPGPTNPVPPTPPITPIVPPTPPVVVPPGTPPTSVPEPSAIAMFLVGAAAVILARHFHQRRLAGSSARAG